MKKMYETKSHVFATGHDDFYLEIVETIDRKTKEPMYDSWLFRKDYGFKTSIIGEYKKNYPGMTVTQYARTLLDYISEPGTYGTTMYDHYQMDLDAMEEATCKFLDEHTTQHG